MVQTNCPISTSVDRRIQIRPGYRIVLLTCDKYIRAIFPFHYLLNKYWKNPPDVLVAGFSYPDFQMPAGFSFHSIGTMEDYPIGRWSEALIKLFEQIPDDVFLLMLEDMWIVRQVDTDVMKMCYDYMVQFEYVARLDVTGDRAGAGDAKRYGDLGNVGLIWSDPDGPYHMSMMPGFWRKKHLLRALIPGESPWDVEIAGTPRLGKLRHEMIVLGTDAWPLKNTLAFRGGDVSKLLLDEIPPDDVAEMRSLGFLEAFE